MADIPNGVPFLQDPTVEFDSVNAVTSDGANLPNNAVAIQWGIFDSKGQPVITGDSCLAFEYARDSSVANYPVENGGFASYNKVQTPFRLKFTFTKGGTDSDRVNFLNDIKVAQDALEPFTGFTSDKTYSNITIDHYDYHRSSRKGVQLLTVDVWCQEIRESPDLKFTSGDNTTPITDPADSESGGTINGGTNQGQNQNQTSTPGGSEGATGEDDSALNPPATITAPGVSITNARGNIVPRSTVSPIQSYITYSSPGGPLAGAVTGVVTGGLRSLPKSYALMGGSLISLNRVTHILPPGFTGIL